MTKHFLFTIILVLGLSQPAFAQTASADPGASAPTAAGPDTEAGAAVPGAPPCCQAMRTPGNVTDLRTIEPTGSPVTPPTGAAQSRPGDI